MTTSLDFESPVHLNAVAADNQPAVTPALEDLYRGFERELLVADDEMVATPRQAQPAIVSVAVRASRKKPA